jgi:hypothetical protein
MFPCNNFRALLSLDLTVRLWIEENNFATTGQLILPAGDIKN